MLIQCQHTYYLIIQFIVLQTTFLNFKSGLNFQNAN